MPLTSEVIIIGGGLSGLTAALHLNKAGVSVTLIEKAAYPHHKVCGEYVSNEVLPYLSWLDIDINSMKPAQINNLQFTASSGKSIFTHLPMGGFGISRYCLDHHLYQLLIKRGVSVVKDEVTDFNFVSDHFCVETAGGKTFNAKYVIGAFGKRSALDFRLSRSFLNQRAPFLAVKAHYRGSFSDTTVSLNNFRGGYCGISKVEDDKLNVCYLANYESFKKHKSIQAYQENVLYKNPRLKEIFENASLLFEHPMSISQVSFASKAPVENHIMMIGDTAGLIHPLCGNGMAMAIHSAKLLCELLVGALKSQTSSRLLVEQEYVRLWNQNFKKRLAMGKWLSFILANEKLEQLAFNSITKMPFLLNTIIKGTHGKTITGSE